MNGGRPIITSETIRKILPETAKLFSLKEESFSPVDSHEGGRNITFRCEDKMSVPRILRISHLSDRSNEDILAETEFVRYLAENGAPVAGIVPSVNGKTAERIEMDGIMLTACLFEVAKGDQIAEHGYKYRDGASLTEYFFNCGKTLGRIHALAKKYAPVNRRFGFFDKYNEDYFKELIPDELEPLRQKLISMLDTLRTLPAGDDDFGLIHFDFSDGNYMIDYDTGDITAFDFDNCRYGWYLFDLANLWNHGVGWIAWEANAEKRRAYMDNYFAHVLAGYRSETTISDEMLMHMPFMIQVVLMENIIDEFETLTNEGEEIECDGEQAYRIRCIMDDIPYLGFFHPIYSPDAPFELED